MQKSSSRRLRICPETHCGRLQCSPDPSLAKFRITYGKPYTARTPPLFGPELAFCVDRQRRTNRFQCNGINLPPGGHERVRLWWSGGQRSRSQEAEVMFEKPCIRHKGSDWKLNWCYKWAEWEGRGWLTDSPFFLCQKPRSTTAKAFGRLLRKVVLLS